MQRNFSLPDIKTSLQDNSILATLAPVSNNM